MANVAELEAARAGSDRCGVSGQESGHALVRLLGSCEGLPSPLIYRKAWALLGFLALEADRLHSRSMLAALLWPGLSETSALTNLRQVLSNLNRYCVQALGPGVLHIERSAVGVMRGDRALFDIDLLWHSPSQAIGLLNEQHRFLDGMEDLGGLDFHSWLEASRQTLETQLLIAGQRCCDALLEEQRWEQALEVAHTLTARDLWNEENARRMMRAHAGSGRNAAALNVYQSFETMLRTELGLEPCHETQQLRALISAGSVPASQARELEAHAIA